MIKHWCFTGDTHGMYTRYRDIKKYFKFYGYNPEECGVIILGDNGINFFLNEKDDELKKFIQTKCKYKVYCLKGNHDARPTDVENMETIYDTNVCGKVYYEKKYPNIRYFMDTVGTVYNIKGYKILTIGGAYSADKPYRLLRGFPWHENEQLTESEMQYIEHKVTGNSFDFVLTHTCPYSWMPTDLFLPSIDQSKVDNSMEVWLERLKGKINYKIWLFGHYHEDRLVRPGVEMLYIDIVPFENYIKYYITGEMKLPPYYNFDNNYNSEES